ncbi:MAG: putative lipid II flippase FtsW [Candidatus Limiplasma sp.]|nr:putative lipid II flippase FtsW [Clostridiales bacterium]MDY3244648.1 putative lipid II flippase FtsW [Candidatus Limiplasma sp.]
MLEQQPVWRQNRRKRLKPADGTLALILALLMMCGLLTLFSATYYKAIDKGDALLEVKKQLIGVGLGGFLMFLTSRIPYRFWQRPRVVILALTGSFALLVLVLIPGIGVYVNGSRRWLNAAGLSFQPSELAKIASVLYLASTLSFRLKQVERLWTGILPLLAVPAAMFLLILQQPNLSTAGSIMIVAVLMMLLAGARWKHLSLMGIAGLAVGFAYAWVEPYRRERLLSFRNPFAQMSDEGYQLSQSLIAIGSGGLFGRGLGQGRQKFSYLPYPESDFIFAIIGEDFGLFGCCVVILLFVAFAIAGMRIALNCQDRYGCLLAAGITAMISVQAFINIGVVVGILPTTGLPLPFFSAGGTSISLLMAAVGILFNISRYD